MLGGLWEGQAGVSLLWSCPQGPQGPSLGWPGLGSWSGARLRLKPPQQPLWGWPCPLPAAFWGAAKPSGAGAAGGTACMNFGGHRIK